MESTDQDFVEIGVDEEMNDLDDDKADLGRNSKDRESQQQQTCKMDTDENQRKLKPAEVGEEFYDLELDSEPENDHNEEINEEAEENEKELMNMPSLQAVMSDLSQLKQRRRVMVHPIKVQELGHPKVLDIISKVTCEEIKLHFVRPQNKPDEWQGILLMHFGSTKAAQQATENLKSVRSDINIRCKEETAYSSRFMEQWVKEEKGQKRWTDTLLWVKNIPEETKESELYEAFPDAEDITMHRRASKMNGPKETKEAFVVYQNGEAALTAAKTYEVHSPEINGRSLKVVKYHMPQEMLPKGLLKLKERLLVLKYLEKLTEIKSKSDSDQSEAPNWCIQRLEKCQGVVDRDCRARKAAGLPMPSLEELRALKGIRVIRGSEGREILQRLGILQVSAHQRRLNNEKNRVGSSNGTDDGKKPKIQSLFELEDPTVGKPGGWNPRYPSLLGDGPVPCLMAGHPLSSQWGASVSPLRSPLNTASHGYSSLGSVNAPVSNRTVINSSANQMAFLQQGSAVDIMSLMKPQMRTVVLHGEGKTPLLASPGSLETTNPYQTRSRHPQPLLGKDFGEPPNKILRLDRSGSFHVEFTTGDKQGSNAPSGSARCASLMDL